MTTLVLSEDKFREFNRKARRDIGVGVTLFAWGRKGTGGGSPAGGFYNRKGIDYLIDVDKPAKAGNIVTRPAIMLANSVRLEECEGTRPELDFQAIPKARFYDYIFHHECAHALGDIDVTDRKLAKQKAVQNVLMVRNEILADRAAWKLTMGADAEMPCCEGGQEYAAQIFRELEKINGYVGRLPRAFDRWGPMPESWAVRADFEHGGPLFHGAAKQVA